ncbi:hypothetical protein F5148DRAFT_552871 [Russula earlei]|uniref:Uncharacterized protein n=1 Tax=Russula earlei TaxID=71964 RepID=A0ACC0TXK6_9AGAM|nr:hypothetical protein F5148DRAFT_552871 [Russula earlei]
MIVVLSILAATRASPFGTPSPPLLSLDQSSATSCDDPKGCRSLWDIIRSCAITIILCIWVSVHPNIPSPHERWPRVTVRRIGLMLAALFVPEIMIAWALRQRQLAVALAEEHKDDGWTTTHGFFAIMGGFMEYEGNRPVRVLFPEELKSYSLTGNGDFPRIAKEEIEDRSKGDVISKTLVILQTGWFVMQCIARGVQHLPITELELVTVAFATLNFVMYLLWWDKPLHVQRGVRVYKKRNTEEAIDDGDVECTCSVGFWGALRESLLELPAAIVRGPLITHASFGDYPRVSRILLWPIVQLFSILMGSEERYHDMKSVDTFYPNAWYAGNELCAGFFVVAVASTFGGIHCIGWSFTFSSITERTLWRVASVLITVVPGLLSSYLLPPEEPYMDMDIATGAVRWKDPSLMTCAFILLVAYLVGRLILLVLPFLSLRSLPPAAYYVLHWTSFIPHV